MATGGTEPVAILIDSYTPSEAVLQAIDQGDVLVFEKKYNDEMGAYQYLIRTESGVGGTPAYDTDDDNVPTTEDNCRNKYNPDQRDSDGDGFGDACDGDINNDGAIDGADLDLVNTCDGVDVSTGIAFGEPADYDGEGGTDFGIEVEPTSQEQAEAYMRCRTFDLNGDGTVDFNDRNMIEASTGGSPGPSGAINRAPSANAGPDREVLCGSSFDVDAGESFDLDGDSLTCRWDSESCSIDGADSCDAVVTCPPGGAHTLVLTVDDGTTTASDSFVANSGSCSPGQIGNSLRVGKIQSSPGFPRVQLDFGNECTGGSSGIVRYGVYEGDLNLLSTATQVTCTASSGSIISPQADAAFFLIAPNAGPYEGSLGQASDGSERSWVPQAQRCRTVQALPVCPVP